MNIDMSTAVVFLPGAGADPAFWSPVAEQLPAGWSATRLAWPGLGHNPPVPGIDSLDDLVRLTQAALPPGPVHLVAQSLGGAIALRVALREPSRVRSLVLATSAAGLDVEHLRTADWRVPYREEYPEAAQWVYSARSNLEGELDRVLQPTLLLWGDADPISPVAVGQYLSERLPTSHLHVVRGGTHALALERADEVAPLLVAHIERSAGQAAS